MAKVNCESCDDLRSTAPNLAVKGFTDAMCTSLKNNTGLVTSSGHNDCEDLNDMNDCLVGMMDKEIDAYKTCDWKKYLHRLVPNLWTTLKGIICSICGAWVKLDKLDCEVKQLFDGYSFNVGEKATDKSYMIAGKGVTFLMDSTADDFASDISLFLVGGALTKMSGTVRFNVSDFTEPTGVSGYNYDLDDTGGSNREPRKSNARKGNSEWSTTGGSKHMVDGGELVWEIRIKRSAYPEVKKIFQGFGQNLNTGSYTVTVYVFDEGEWAYGQHGSCYSASSTSHTPGNPRESGYSYGHKVEEGYTYIQCRMNFANILCGSSGTIRTTPTTFLGMRFYRDKIDC